MITILLHNNHSSVSSVLHIGSLVCQNGPSHPKHVYSGVNPMVLLPRRVGRLGLTPEIIPTRSRHLLGRMARRCVAESEGDKLEGV